MKLLASLAAVTGIVCLTGMLSPGSAHAAPLSPDAMCNRAYPNQFSRTYSITLGTKRIYNRDASRGLVCNGGFGAPDGFKPTRATACDFIIGAHGIRHPTAGLVGSLGCGVLHIGEQGWVRGSISTAAGIACGYAADVLGTGLGVLAAGVTLQPELGVAVWGGTTFVGDTIVCIGIDNLTRTARSWGVRLEANHEMHVARDIQTRGKCLQLTKRRVIGLQWSAIDCPSGFGGTRIADPAPAAPVQPPTNNPTPNPVPVDPVPVDPVPGGVPDQTPSIPAGSYPETVGGVTHVWTDYTSAGGSEGPSIATGQTVGITCKVQGFPVADGNTWWYRVASSPWNGSYYASADAFYNNGQTSGSLVGTPFVDSSVPDCFAPPPTPTFAETTGGVAHTWTNYLNAGGNEGPSISSNQTVQIACKLQGFRVSDGNTWWYRIAEGPWNGAYYVSADAFYNNGQTSGSLIGTPFVDPAVADC